MTKAELINYVAESAGITRVKAETIVNTTLTKGAILALVK